MVLLHLFTFSGRHLLNHIKVLQAVKGKRVGAQCIIRIMRTDPRWLGTDGRQQAKQQSIKNSRGRKEPEIEKRHANEIEIIICSF